MKLDFLASEQHYIDHMLPIWENLPGDYRGEFYTKEINKREDLIPYKTNHHLTQLLKNKKNPIIGSSYGEVLKLKRSLRPIVLMEHGSGQTYLSDNPYYASGRGLKDEVSLFLAPNEYNAQGYKTHYPDTQVEVIGCPKLDNLLDPKPKDSTIAISFHWDCFILPETRSSFEYFKNTLAPLANKFKLLGHGHPRLINKIKPIYQFLDIEVVENFDEVVERADLYICDNSSTLFEFAALDRPVVVLNPPWYRKDIEHGLRFWEFSDVGLNCNDPEDLIPTVYKALEDPEDIQIRRREITEQIYPYLGESLNKTTKVLIDFLDNYTPKSYYATLNRGFSYTYRGFTFKKNIEVELPLPIYKYLKRNKYFITREGG